MILLMMAYQKRIINDLIIMCTFTGFLSYRANSTSLALRNAVHSLEKKVS